MRLKIEEKNAMICKLWTRYSAETVAEALKQGRDIDLREALLIYKGLGDGGLTAALENVGNGRCIDSESTRYLRTALLIDDSSRKCDVGVSGMDGCESPPPYTLTAAGIKVNAVRALMSDGAELKQLKEP